MGNADKKSQSGLGGTVSVVHVHQQAVKSPYGTSASSLSGAVNRALSLPLETPCVAQAALGRALHELLEFVPSAYSPGTFSNRFCYKQGCEDYGFLLLFLLQVFKNSF